MLKFVFSVASHPLVFTAGVAVGVLFGYQIKKWLVARAAQLEATVKTVVH